MVLENKTVSTAHIFTESRDDDAQGDQGLIDVGALRQSVPAVAGVGPLTAKHKTQETGRLMPWEIT